MYVLNCKVNAKYFSEFSLNLNNLPAAIEINTQCRGGGSEKESTFLTKQ